MLTLIYQRMRCVPQPEYTQCHHVSHQVPQFGEAWKMLRCLDCEIMETGKRERREWHRLYKSMIMSC